MNDTRSLNSVRKKLGRKMTEKGTGGFSFERVFGCDPKNTNIFSHIRVLVELRSTMIHTPTQHHFRVEIDPCVSLKLSPEQAKEYLVFFKKAVRFAAWVESVVQGERWSNEEVWAAEQ